MNTATGALSALRRLGVATLIAVVFLFGLGTTVYLSLRSPEVTVPDVLGKDRFQAEQILSDAGLNFRVRATRPSSELKADTVLFQVPRAGEVVKAGQTVAMDISRTAKEGEASQAVVEPKPEEKNSNANTAESVNENKPKRPKPANKNANDNANGNLNANRPAANRNANSNSRNVNSGNSNTNRPALIINNINGNANLRPAAPKPSPSAKPKETP